MTKSSSNRNVNKLPVTDDPGIDGLHHRSEDVHDVRQHELPRYRIEVENADGGTRRVDYVHADSMQEALVKIREADWWPRDALDGFRVVEATEEGASSKARHQRNARRSYLNTIVEAGLTALGKTTPDRSDHESSDILCDFFTRSVILPGHFAFPQGDAKTDRLLDTDDVAGVLTQLLTTHLSHHGLKVVRTLNE